MLTPKQKEVYEYIQGYIAKNGFAPSLRDIMNGLSLASPSTVHRHLQELERKKFIRMGGYHAKRSIEVLSSEALSMGIFELPLLGSIAAGEPLEIVEESRETVEVPSCFTKTVKSQKRYVLQVSGDSMIDMGLLDGDYVVIEQRDYANDGEVVAALLNGGATLKEYRKGEQGVVLYPKNTKYHPIPVRKQDDFLIRGVLVGSFRQYGVL